MKNDLTLQLIDFLSTDICRSFYELKEVFTSLLFSLYFDVIRSMKLKINLLDLVIFGILSQNMTWNESWKTIIHRK